MNKIGNLCLTLEVCSGNTKICSVCVCVCVCVVFELRCHCQLYRNTEC